MFETINERQFRGLVQSVDWQRWKLLAFVSRDPFAVTWNVNKAATKATLSGFLYNHEHSVVAEISSSSRTDFARYS
jgi:hypothetical protein